MLSMNRCLNKLQTKQYSQQASLNANQYNKQDRQQASYQYGKTNFIAHNFLNKD